MNQYTYGVPVFGFLLSDGAARITGENIVVSGGN